MKKILKVIGIIFIVIIIVAVLLFVYLQMQPFVPTDYIEKVETGGDIEAKYLKLGDYDVSYMEVDTDETFEKYEIYYPSKMKKTNDKYPLVIFANGTGVKASRYRALFEHLASWGFIVIGNEDSSSWNGYSSVQSLDYMIRQNNNQKSIFYNKIDVDNIGISGHSQGGVAVFNAITNYDNSNMYKVAVVLSPANEDLSTFLNWPYDVTKVKIPVMIASGTEGIFENQIVLPFDNLKQLYEELNVDKLMIRKTGYIHRQMIYQADGYVTAWFIWHLYDDKNASAAFIGSDPEVLSNKLYQDQRIDIKEE